MTAEQERLFVTHLYLAARAADRWAGAYPGGRGLWDDFYAAALVELWRAAVRYDAAAGPFTHYASVCVNLAVKDWFRSKTSYFGGWRRTGPPSRVPGAFEAGGLLSDEPGLAEDAGLPSESHRLAVEDDPPAWEARELVDRLLRAVAEPHRTRARRYYMGGEDSPAIARSEGVAKTNVCRSVKAALRRMRDEARALGLLEGAGQ